MPKKMPRYICDCADGDGPADHPGGYFAYGRTYRESEVERIFEDRIADMKPHILPGLRLIGEDGQEYQAELRVVLTPIPGGD